MEEKYIEEKEMEEGEEDEGEVKYNWICRLGTLCPYLVISGLHQVYVVQMAGSPLPDIYECTTWPLTPPLHAPHHSVRGTVARYRQTGHCRHTIGELWPDIGRQATAVTL